MKLLILLILQINIDAIEDVVTRKAYLKNTLQLKRIMHIVQSIHILFWLIIIFHSDFAFNKQIGFNTASFISLGKFVLSYSLIRFALFDYMYNMASTISLNYVGNSSFYDLGLRYIYKIFKKSPIFASWIIFILKILSLVAGVKILFTLL